jgi:DNA-binding XRE family transcriptional regulator
MHMSLGWSRKNVHRIDPARALLLIQSNPETAVPKTGFYRKLAERVRARREALGLTQAELAEKADVSRSSIANLETGRQAILVHQFVGLAKALELPWTELMPEIDEPATADVRVLPKAVEAFVAAVKPRNGAGKQKR